ncbi:hypothetical protein L9F63_018054, partial [Diploptera punctata]
PSGLITVSIQRLKGLPKDILPGDCIEYIRLLKNSLSHVGKFSRNKDLQPS